MERNKYFIKEFIKELKKTENKKELLVDTINKIENIFKTKDFNKKDQEYSYAFEKLKKDDENITPEILSSLEELLLTIDSSRYETGSYYTNKKLINRILNEIKTKTDIKYKKIIDPACGTGNFLINIILSIKEIFKTKEDLVSYLEKYVYANDLMKSSTETYLKRINYITIDIFNEELSKEDNIRILKNITNKDFLLDYNEQDFDIIIGNPPYLGTKSLGKKYLNELNKIFGFTDDLYSLFSIKSLGLLNKNGFLSFVTSNTYFTLKSKYKMRKSLVENGLYKIINNNSQHFGIMTNTAIFFIEKSNKKEDIYLYEENDEDKLCEKGILNIKDILVNDYRFVIRNQKDECLNELFDKSIEIFNKYKKELATSKSLSKFKESDEFTKLIKENDVLPLGLIAYIGTGVDFKGFNKDVLYSVKNKKYNLIEDEKLIKSDLTVDDFNSGLKESEFKYINAIKGTEFLYVKWDKETFDFLKEIKAPLRNLHLYGDEMIYCKTSTYHLTKIDKNTLCINTAGSCFIKPIINIAIDDLYDQINKIEIKDFIKENINNSLSFTPNDIKLIPIKIR